MKTVLRTLTAILLAVSTLVPFGASSAMPMSPSDIVVKQSSEISNAAWRRVCNQRGCRRVWVDRRRVIVRPPIYVQPRVVIRPRTVIRRAGNMHVNWCYNRYQSYDARTDTYLGFDGLYHRCLSPYM